MAKILVLHGPNLNLLGVREPHIYGDTTLEQIDRKLADIAETAGHSLISRQSNAEHQLVEYVQSATEDRIAYIIINPAAYTHTSVALRDALIASQIPFVEVHLSNIHGREEFRHHSYFSDMASGVICGLGAQGYEFALEYAVTQLNNQ